MCSIASGYQFSELNTAIGRYQVEKVRPCYISGFHSFRSPFSYFFKPPVLHQSNLRNGCVNMMVKMEVVVGVSWLPSRVNYHAKRQSQGVRYPLMTEAPLTQPA